MHERFSLLGVAAALLLPACAHYPVGPSVMVLPGNGKTLAQFQADDALCRDWAGRQSGASPQQAATGSGLLAGSFAGLQRSEWAGSSVQSRYDNAYLQCMYASGNQIPLPRNAFAGYAPGPYASRAPAPPPPPGTAYPPAPGSTAPPPPPAGAPPPPPPDAG
jgi:hypothetical protein